MRDRLIRNRKNECMSLLENSRTYTGPERAEKQSLGKFVRSNRKSISAAVSAVTGVAAAAYGLDAETSLQVASTLDIQVADLLEDTRDKIVGAFYYAAGAVAKTKDIESASGITATIGIRG